MAQGTRRARYNGVIAAGRHNVNITRLNFEQGDTGLRIADSSHITAVDNSFTNGIRTGIEVQDFMFVLIEANNFTDLALANNIFYGKTFAEDSCSIQISDRDCNFWDNGTIGNYRGDYNGSDSNGDGIGNTPVHSKWV